MREKPVNIYSENLESKNPVSEDANVTITATSDNEDFDFIPCTVYENLPPLLKESCNLFNDKYERDLFLLGALTTLGGSYHNLVAYNNVDKKKVSTNLLSFIVAPPASGKGVLRLSKKLVDDIKQTFSNNSKKVGTKETNKLVIPVNISSAGLIEILDQNNGIGLMVESEIDVLVNANKQDWGNYSDILRNSFENESCSLYRKGDKQLQEVENIRLALVISGTPSQFKSLMNSAENGLFSRGLYYTFCNNDPKLKCFERINTEIDLDKQINNFSKKANLFYEKHLQFDSIKVVFSREQLSKIEEILQEEYDAVKNIDELKANVKRAFINIQKIAALLMFLEVAEDGKLSEEIFCGDNILQTAIDFTLTSLKHSYYVYELLPKKIFSNISLNQKKLFSSLPNEFSRTDAIKMADEMGLNVRTIDNYIKVYKDKKMVEVPSHGKFRKLVKL